MSSDPVEADDVRRLVRDRYGRVASETGRAASESGKAPGNAKSAIAEKMTMASNSGGCCGDAAGCCSAPLAGTLPANITQSLGYDENDLTKLPEGADMGLSCGNPVALAGLREGEVVVDLGSGGGLDVFLAGPRVGAAGRVIGVDMTPEMLSQARRAVAAYRARSGLDNVEFRLGEIENLPLADASVDVVISNCVINLSPDKPRVWREIARVLRPGGRVAVSDLALWRPLPAAIAGMIEAYVGCIAGASLVDDIREMATDAGLREIALEPRSEFLDAYEGSDDPLYRQIAQALPVGMRLRDFVTSLSISAVKPETARRLPRERT